MKKILKIEGMSCGHCQARIEKALNSLTGVQAKVDLKKAQATVKVADGINDEKLVEVVAAAGYKVIDIRESKGLFS